MPRRKDYKAEKIKLSPKPPNFVPVKEFPEGHRYHGTKMRRCQAWSSRNGRQCMGIAVTGMNVCRAHGGSSPKGMASPAWKGRGYSKYIPVRLKDLIADVEMSQARLLESWDEIALLRVRLMDVLTRTDTHEAGYWWSIAKTSYKKFIKAMRAPTTTELEARRQAQIMEEALDELGNALDAGGADYKAWEEVYKVVERLSRVQERQVKTLVAKDNVITNQQFLAILDTIISSINSEIDDDYTRRRLVTKLITKFEPQR